MNLKAHTVCNMCTLACVPVTMSEAWGNCDMNILMNGCETDLKTKDDCGVCDNVCNMGNCVWNGMDNWICMNS